MTEGHEKRGIGGGAVPIASGHAGGAGWCEKIEEGAGFYPQVSAVFAMYRKSCVIDDLLGGREYGWKRGDLQACMLELRQVASR